MQPHDHGGSTLEAFLPHGFCYLWNPQLLWTHVVSDLLIGFAYVAISTTLVFLVVRGRREFPFQAMFLAFGLFIIACAATHFVEVYTLWNPVYWFSAGIKVITAGASVGTALLLPPLVPRILHTVREAKLSEGRRVAAESAGRFRTLAEGMPQIVWTAEPDGAVDYYNHRWFDFTGISVEGGHGWGWQGVIHPADEARTTARWEASMATGEPYEIEHRLRASDGEYRWFLSRALPLRDGSGQVAKWLGSATDIDAQRAVTDELRRAKEAAEAAGRAKDEFLAVMSHELRTPLNAVIGYLDLMDAGVGGTPSEQHAQYLGRVRTSTDHLRGIIDQVLSVARDEGERAPVQPQRVRVFAVLDDVAAITEPLARAKGIEFRLRAAVDDPEVETDEGMLRQILLNLAGNAVKFTERGVIEISVEQRDDAMLVSVRDTGIGIREEFLERIFEPFWQADQSHTRTVEGTGLGLSIARRMAQRLGGELSVESVPGAGSVFRVSIPCRAPMPAA